MLRAAVPDFHEVIEDQVVEGNKEMHRYVIRGTHQGEFMGIPATGKEVVVTGITLARIEEGKIAEEWSQADMLGLMQQLGVVPAN
jgi:predicted ester cyclase